MPITPTGAAPYRQVAALLRRTIADNMAPGDKLPSTRELADLYKVTLNTVVRAIDLLRTEGLVITERGRGNYVANAPKRAFRRESRHRYGRARSDNKLLSSRLEHTITFAGEVAAPTDIAGYFQIDVGEPIVLRERVLSDENGPVELGKSWLNADEVRDTEMTQAKRLPKALFLTMEDITGRIYSEAEDLWIARMPTAEEADKLGIRGTTPLLTVRHIARDGNGKTIEISESAWPGDRAIMIDRYPIPQHAEEPVDPSEI